ACSDVTGYGLLGHALEMAGGSNLTLVFESARLPLLPHAVDLADKGVLTGGCKRNRDYLADKVSIDSSVNEGLVEVAYDPQTSGGLLIAVPEKSSAELVEQLRAGGVTSATAIGYCTTLQKTSVMLV